MEEILKQILEENKRMTENVQKMAEEIKKLANGQARMEKQITNMAKDIKAIKDFQHKRYDVVFEKLQTRVKRIEEYIKLDEILQD